MIRFKTGLSKKEKKEVSFLLFELTDIYSDFYITKNNLRLFIKENQDILFECLRRGDKIAFSEGGLGVIVGFSDKASRKYLKILTKTDKDVDSLIKIISWNLDCDLYVKIKKNNPLREVLERNYFRFIGGRGKEILLVKKAKKKYANKTKTKNS